MRGAAVPIDCSGPTGAAPRVVQATIVLSFPLGLLAHYAICPGPPGAVI